MTAPSCVHTILDTQSDLGAAKVHIFSLVLPDLFFLFLFVLCFLPVLGRTERTEEEAEAKGGETEDV